MILLDTNLKLKLFTLHKYTNLISLLTKKYQSLIINLIVVNFENFIFWESTNDNKRI